MSLQDDDKPSCELYSLISIAHSYSTYVRAVIIVTATVSYSVRLEYTRTDNANRRGSNTARLPKYVYALSFPHRRHR
jgi:hypothetical protein